MPRAKSRTPIQRAIEKLGGQTATATIVGKKQSSIFDYAKTGKPPLDVAMRIELATNGEFPVEALRPDVAGTVREFFARRLSVRSAA